MPLHASLAQTTAPVAKPFASAAPAGDDISAVSVRFFGSTCLKYVAAPKDLISFMDGIFSREDQAGSAAFRVASHATPEAIVWVAPLPEGSFGVVWDPGHEACTVIGQKIVDQAKVRAEFNKMLGDINTSGQLNARLVPAPVKPGVFNEYIEIDGMPGRKVDIVAAVNTAPRAGDAGSFYTLFVRHLPATGKTTP